jgi:hypothetical protein
VDERGDDHNDHEQVHEQRRPAEQQCLSGDGHEVRHVHRIAHVPVGAADHHLARRGRIGRERRSDAFDREAGERREIHQRAQRDQGDAEGSQRERPRRRAGLVAGDQPREEYQDDPWPRR